MGSRMVHTYGMVETSLPTREPASLSALCLNTAAGQGKASSWTCSKARSILLLYHRKLWVSAKAAVQFVPRALPVMFPHSNPWATQACSCMTIVFPSSKTLEQHQLLCATCQGLAAQALLQKAVLQTGGSRKGAAVLLVPCH